jgi:hypothetical protein
MMLTTDSGWRLVHQRDLPDLPGMGTPDEEWEAVLEDRNTERNAAYRLASAIQRGATADFPVRGEFSARVSYLNDERTLLGVFVKRI